MDISNDIQVIFLRVDGSFINLAKHSFSSEQKQWLCEEFNQKHSVLLSSNLISECDFTISGIARQYNILYLEKQYLVGCINLIVMQFYIAQQASDLSS